MYANEGCPIYVEHVLAEHRRLHNMLRLARAAIVQSGGPDRDATTADLVRVFQQVRSELAHHFAEEEGGGCLEEAVSRCPRLSGQARRIEAEHPALLRDLDALIVGAQASEKSVEARQRMEQAFKALCERLHAHEAAENNLLRQAFGANVNGDENGAGRKAVCRSGK
jgi:iron-sulfur cluster repair protein YtfE (RIC family)